MEYNEEKLNEFRTNQKTQFLASQFDALINKRKESELLLSDEAMKELAEEEIQDGEEEVDSQHGGDDK